MMRFNAVVLASLLLFVGVTGCNRDESNEAVVATPQAVPKRPRKQKAAAPKPKATASPAATPTASPAKGKTPAAPAGTTTTPPSARVKQTFAKLNGYLPAAVKKLQANDIATAKKYAQDFNANWQQLQNLVKTTSQPSYQKIAAAVTQVTNTLITPATPDKAKAIASLQSLSQAVTEYAKSP